MKIWGFTVLLLLGPITLVAQNGDEVIIPIDLATAPAKDTATVVPAKYRLRLLNRLPAAHYRIRVAVAKIPLDLIPYPEDKGTGHPLVGTCPAVTKAESQLTEATSEKEVPRLIRQLNDSISKANPISCASAIGQARMTIRNTEYVDSTIYNVKSGTKMTVTINRVDKDGITEQTWQLVNTTPQDTRWTVSYGYAFAAMRGLNRVFRDQRAYFSKSVPNDSAKFVITEDSNERWNSFPSVFFHVENRSGLLKYLPLTSGLSLDLEDKFAVLLGIDGTYFSNLHLSAGVMMQKEFRLKDRYSPGDTVSTQLDADALHVKTIAPRPFLSISWRFAKNPFASGNSADSQPEAQEDKPKDNPKNKD